MPNPFSPRSATMMQHRHILLVTFPAQGHINPTLQFAKRLVRAGVDVTLATSVCALRRMVKTTLPDGLTLAAYSDGYDNGFNPACDADKHQYMLDIKHRGSETLAELIQCLANDGRPVTYLVHTTIIPWAGKVARDLHIPSALLWIQPATVFDIYYYYFNDGYGEVIENKSKDPSYPIQLPGLPPLQARDLPSFLVAPTLNSYLLQAFREQLEILDEETNPRILVNTFDALEPDALRAVDHKLKLIGIGPLIPSAFLDGQDPSDASFGCDLFQHSMSDYINWLNSKPESSVVYVSFGSFSVLSTRQMDEIAQGLLDSGRPFLWVIRAEQSEAEGVKGEKMRWREEVERVGMVVSWCCQVEVLSHPTVGCFMTHCGWNSTLESVVSGVPVVGFPQWLDQGTNAKLVEEVWGTGMRMRVNEDGVVGKEEITRCVKIVIGGGERGVEMRRNARKWKELAREAVKEGGSSDKNVKAFLNDVGSRC